VDAQHLILEGKEEDLEGDIEEEEEDNLLINSEKIIIKIVIVTIKLQQVYLIYLRSN